MEFKNYDYTSTPSTMSRIYDIHSLSNKGLNQYLSPDSHFHNYLEKINQSNLQRNFIKQNSIKDFNGKTTKKYFEEKNENDYNENIEENNNYDYDYDIKSTKQRGEYENKTSNYFYPNYVNKEKRRPFNSMVIDKSICSFYRKSNNYLNSKKLEFRKSINSNTNQFSNINRLEKSYNSNSNIFSSKDKDYSMNRNKSQSNFTKSFQGIRSLKNLKAEKESNQLKRTVNIFSEKNGRSISNFKKLYNNIYSKNDFTGNETNLNKNGKLFNITKNNSYKKPYNLTNNPSYRKLFEETGKSWSKLNIK